MLHGNPQACEKALAKAGLSCDDMAVIEVNEAFASVVLQFLKDTGLHERWEAATSTRTAAASRSATRSAPPARGSPRRCSPSSSAATRRYGIASMCIGFGQAIAGVVERL